eukprot:756409-Hanusia_phi.AAC.2
MTCLSLASRMAPEVIKQEAYGRKADVWSLGMTVSQLRWFRGMRAGRYWRCRRPNIPGRSSATSSRKTANALLLVCEILHRAMTEIASGSSLPEVPGHLSAMCKDFIICCIQR